MKRLMLNTMIAAAALAAVAAGASAQTMKAEVPFQFRVGKTVMTPGAYQVAVERTPGGDRLLIRNTDTGKGVLALPMTFAGSINGWTEDAKPRLEFDCGGERCILRQVHPTGSGLSYLMPGPKATESTKVTEVVLSSAKSE